MTVITINRSGARIRAARKRAQLSSTQLAAILDCSHGHLTQVEGGTRPASRGFLERVAEALAVPLSHLADPDQLKTPEERAWEAGYEAARRELVTAEPAGTRHRTNTGTRVRGRAAVIR